MLLRHPLQWAVLSILIFSSAALNPPASLNKAPQLNPTNTTNSPLNPQPEQLPNLTYAPWPPQPYEIPIHSPFVFSDLVIIRAREFHGSRPVSTIGLQTFLLEFRDNLEREYPIPGLVPRVASQNAYDMQSYTKWTIEVNESLLGRRMRTATAVVVLEEIGRLLGRYGPANLVFSVKERYVTLSVGFLGIMEFGEGDGDGGVQTS